MLVEHVRRELELVGEDQDVIDWAVKVAEAYASYGHSGGSHAVLHPMLFELLDAKNISPLTNDPDEWTKHEPEMWDGEHPIWQNKRNSTAFSPDGGSTYYFLGESTLEPEKFHKSAPMKPHIV